MTRQSTEQPPPSIENILKEGNIVVFEQDGQPQLGVVTAVLSNKAKILSMRERTAEIPFVRLDIVPGRLPADLSYASQKASYLLSLRDNGLEAALHVPLEDLWTFVHEEGGEFRIAELVELYYGESSTEEHLTLRFALYDDSIFFKRKKYIFLPRTVETVQELQRAAEARVEKERLLEEALSEVMAGKGGEGTYSDSTEELLRRIERIAAGGAHVDNSELKEVQVFLEHYEARASTSIRGGREERAYHFLRSLGRFHKNTNLTRIRHQAPRGFSSELQAEGEKLRELMSLCDSREDITALDAFTIDDESTKDMDDALSLEALDEGYRLGIHIADVASLVSLGSPLDEEAKNRGTSLYFPEGNVNMFPEVLAEDLCSLRAHEKRPVVSCFLTFSSDYDIIDTQIALSTLAVAERHNYDDVDKLLDPPCGPIGTVYQIAMSCEATRLSNGGLKIPKRQVKVCLSDVEHLATSNFTLEPYSESTPSRSLIGEMMIFANVAMATFARDNKIPFIFRSQEAQEQSVIDARLEGVPPGPAYDAATRGTLKRSVTGTTPAPHATLGVGCYAQVTSPIRRYGDLINQRQLVAFLQGEPLPYTAEQIEGVLLELSDPLQRSRLMSRETHRFWVLKYLKQKAQKRETIDGTVVRDDGPQYQIELDEVFIPVLLKTKRKLKKGDRVVLALQKVDPVHDYLKVGLS